MQKGILKLTKRPLVQAFFFSFFQEPVALYLGQYSEEPQTIFFFMRHLVLGFKLGVLRPTLYFILSVLKAEVGPCVC